MSLIREEAHFGDRVMRCYAARPTSLYALFADAAQRQGNKEALVSADERLTWRALEERVAQTAAGLAARGIRAGERVALLLGNRTEFVVSLFAASRLGAITVPLNIREQKPELAYVLAHCGARLIVHEPELADRLPPIEQRIPADEFEQLA